MPAPNEHSQPVSTAHRGRWIFGCAAVIGCGLYILSLGPVVWLYLNIRTPWVTTVLDLYCWPINEPHHHGPPPIPRPIEQYAELWAPPGGRASYAV